LIAEMKHPIYPPDLAVKIDCLKGMKISGNGRHSKTKMWWQHWKLFHNRGSKNVSNNGSITEPSA